MAMPPPLNEAQVRALASAESFQRGREYYQSGAVERLVRRGDHVEAEVAGSDYAPYQVTATLGPTGVTAADCTCPYDWGGACKHVVAALLVIVESPDAVEERPPLATVLAPLDRAQLQQLLLALAETDPSLTARIEMQATTLVAAPQRGGKAREPRPIPPAIDPKDLRRQVRGAVGSLQRMRSSEAYAHEGDVVREVVRLAAQARPFFEAGDVPTALAVLEAVTTEYLDVWVDLDGGSGESAEAFDDLGELWAEALLSGELAPADRDHWTTRLAEWQADLGDYGVDDAFFLAETALQEGWTAPALVAILRGEAPAASVPDTGRAYPAYRPDLTDIRLKVLERQERTEEYLHLAAATGRRAEYGRMLAALGRGAEAVEYGLTTLATPAEALALAQTLHAQGAVADALRVAERGFTLETPRSGYQVAAWDPRVVADDDAAADEDGEAADEVVTADAGGGDYQRAILARWLRDVAHAAGDGERALHAAAQVVRDDPSLADYLGAQTLAGARWPALREELLAHLRGLRTYQMQAKVDVFLHEGLTEDAVAVADQASHSYELVEQVADAAIASHPAWVIAKAREQAHEIIERGNAGHYDAAARWLARWRDAARAAGSEREWRAYLDDVRERHRRKYKLMPLLRDLAD